MCRWLAYTGNPVAIGDILFAPRSLIDQSMSSRSAETPTNGDGFGLGWYRDLPTPGLFRSIRPAWNDFNLRDLAVQARSPLFMAHVRATSLATVQETNCHPFRWGKWLFVHNGEIFEVEKVRRDLVMQVGEKWFNNMQGTTDSELMFHLALTLGLEEDPPGALRRMAGMVERAGRARGVDEILWMTLGVTDGRSLWAVRYASDGKAPTLYHSRDVADIAAFHPGVLDRFSPEARMIVSEPVGEEARTWVEVPQGSCLHAAGGEIRVEPFRPE
ncbi:MAG: class II glutamine amidotransferase [Planctomycetaceae bacterium]|nr:class II glutamine amidotransferase [Planctomycetota bacterium]NUN53380.1 class II glutamine amidotransferase [Planctomycetaceae bacterium]